MRKATMEIAGPKVEEKNGDTLLSFVVVVSDCGWLLVVENSPSRISEERSMGRRDPRKKRRRLLMESVWILWAYVGF
jgi:hypothetical protein